MFILLLFYIQTNYSNLIQHSIINHIMKSKRQNYRKQQRREHLAQFFKAKRLQISYGKNISPQQFTMFNRLNQRINQINNTIPMNCLISDLKYVINNYPCSGHTYIIVANFLLIHPGQYYMFKEYFLETLTIEINKNQKYFYWAFIIFIQAILNNSNHNQKHFMQQLYEIDTFLGSLLKYCIDSFYEATQKEIIEQNIEKIQYLLLSFNLFFQEQEEFVYFPHKTLETFCIQVNKIYTKSKTKLNCNPLFKLKLSVQIKDCALLKILMNRNEEMKKYKIFLIRHIQQMLYDSLQQKQQDKSCILKLMLELSTNYPLQCAQSLLVQQVILSLVYIMDSTQNQDFKILILNFFSKVLTEISTDKLLKLLNVNFHNKLVQVLKTEFYLKNEQIIFQSLVNIKNILQKVQELNDRKFFIKCLSSMENQEQFDKILMEMTLKQNSQRIEKELSYILSSYYSSEIDEEY